MNSSSLSSQVPHFQNLYDNFVAKGDNVRVRGTGTTTTEIDGVSMKRTELKRPTEDKGNDKRNAVRKFLDKAYNVLHGRKLLRKEFKAAAAEVLRYAPNNQEIIDAAIVLKTEANRTRNGHDLKTSFEITKALLTIKLVLNEKIAVALKSTIDIKAHGDWKQAQERGLVKTPCLDDVPKLNLNRSKNPELDAAMKAARDGSHELLANELSKQLKQALSEASIDTQRSFALSKGEHIREQMFNLVNLQLDPGADPQVAMRAVNVAYPMGVSAEATYPEQRGFIPLTFTAAGEQYKLVPDQKLGEAGQSQVAVFENAKGEKVVFKVPIGGDNYENTVHETLVHLAANKASEHTVKLVDTIRMPSGDLAMVLRFAEHGTLSKNMAHADTPHEKFLEKLEQFKVKVPVTQVRAGVRNREAEKRMADRLTAMGELHTAGISHGDYKPENIFLGKNGIQIADFGTAQTEEKGRPAENRCHELPGSRSARGLPEEREEGEAAPHRTRQPGHRSQRQTDKSHRGGSAKHQRERDSCRESGEGPFEARVSRSRNSESGR